MFKMSSLTKNHFIGLADIISGIYKNSETEDDAGNYAITPMPREVLQKEGALEISCPIENRFIICYNPETEKFTLPITYKAITLGKILGNYRKRATLVDLLVDPNPWLKNLVDYCDIDQLYIQLVD